MLATKSPLYPMIKTGEKQKCEELLTKIKEKVDISSDSENRYHHKLSIKK